ncbi:hypothetical protein K474DRAFT_1713149 [Panus rudis PR-1116 ss-1]|nr:hypothetical protein K474DRAFT_1713149 [Panus rudis PR-1116 ss-1]
MKTLHDRESAIYVATYAVVRKTLIEAEARGAKKDRDKCKEFLEEFFACAEYKEIQAARQLLLKQSMAKVPKCIKQYYSGARRLVRSMLSLLRKYHDRRQAQEEGAESDVDSIAEEVYGNDDLVLTHANVLRMIDKQLAKTLS